MSELSDERIAQLLQAEQAPAHPAPEQHGPLRHYDKEMRCASRRCGSPTFFKVQGMPACMIHALRHLNNMLVERGVER